VRTLALLVGVALPFVISPGASFTITVTSAAGGDRRSPIKVWAGTALGISVLALLVTLTGVGGFVAGSPTAQQVFAVVGGAVLILFGALTLRRGLRRGDDHPPAIPASARLVAWSFLALVTNVKALTLYVVIVPTTGVRLSSPLLYLMFGAVHITMLLVWLVLVARLVALVPTRHSDQVRRVLSALGGTFMFALGTQSVFGA
jgi:threonine/homoserine/homoserine lactone efflux protein